MLQVLRNKISGRLFSGIIVVIALAIGFWGAESAFQSSGSSGELARIGSTLVTLEDYSSAVHRAQLQYSDSEWMSIQKAPSVRSTLMSQILSDLVFKYGAMKGIQSYYYHLGESLLRSLLSEVKLFQVDGQFSISQYERVMRQLRLTEKDLMSELKFSFLLSSMNALFSSSQLVLDHELNDLREIERERRDIEVFVVRPNLKQLKRSISSLAIQSYYNQHQSEFKTSPTLVLNYIELPLSKVKQSITVPQEALEKAYHQHLERFKHPPMYRGSRFDFRQVQNAKSGHSGSYFKTALDESGLSHKERSRLEMVLKKGYWKLTRTEDQSWRTLSSQSDIADWIKHLKPGQAVLNNASSSMYTVFKLINFKPAFHESLDAVAPKLRAQLLDQYFQDRLIQVSEALATQVYTTPDTLEPAARHLRLKLNRSVSLNPMRQPLKSIFAQDKLWKAVVRQSQLKLKENSEIIKLKDRWVVFNIQSQQLPQVRPLNQVRDQIFQLLLKEKLHSLKAQSLTRLNRHFQQGDSLDVIESKLKYPARHLVNLSLNPLQLSIADYGLRRSDLEHIFEQYDMNTGILIQKNDHVWYVIKVLKAYLDPNIVADASLNQSQWNHILSDAELMQLKLGLLLDQRIKVSVKSSQLNRII